MSITTRTGARNRRHDRTRSLAIRGCVLATLIALLGPAGATGQSPAPPVAPNLQEAPGWTLQPTVSVLQTGQTQQFAASVPESERQLVAWTSTGGAVTPAGLYQAPAVPGIYVVTATIAGGALRASATVQVIDAQGTRTDAADRFVDSVGINIRLHHQGLLYQDNFPLTKQRLVELGVRHYRDVLVDTTWTPYYDRHNELGTAGLKGVFAVHRPDTPVEALRRFPLLVGSAFEAYEAVNEYDNGPKDWVRILNESLVRLHSTKESPAVAGFPIYGPSMAFSNRLAQLGDVSRYFDYGNLHIYFAGRHPGTAGWGVTERDFPTYGWHLRYARSFFGGKPMVVTESGYMNHPAPADAIPQDVSGKYMPRLLLEHYRQGFARTYIFELADDGAKFNAGLITRDGAPKPAFRAVQGLLRLLADPGPAMTVTPLRYTVSGASPDLRHMAFQKRDGSYYLALWIERSAYDVPAKRPVTVAPATVGIAVAGGLRVVTVHRWQADGTVVPAAPAAGEPAAFTVTDTLQVLELRP